MKSNEYKFTLSGNCKAWVIDGKIVLEIEPENHEHLKEVREEIHGKQIEYHLGSHDEYKHYVSCGRKWEELDWDRFGKELSKRARKVSNIPV